MRLRDFFPKSRISWLIDKRFVHLIEGHSSIDEIICADAPAWVEQIRYRGDIPRGLLHFRIASELKRRQFDSVFDLQNLFRSALLAWSTGAKTRIGLNDWREGAPLCYTKVARPTHRHVIRHYLSIIEAVTGPVNKIRFDLPIRTEAKERISALLDQFGLNEGRPFVVIAPKSSQTFKDWPSDRFAQVVRYLRQRWTLPTVLVGAPKDEETCRQIAIDSEASPRLILGRPLDQLIAILGQASAGDWTRLRSDPFSRDTRQACRQHFRPHRSASLRPLGIGTLNRSSTRSVSGVPASFHRP